jgi:hypothetical protein
VKSNQFFVVAERAYFLVLRELIKLSFCLCVSLFIAFSRFKKLQVSDFLWLMHARVSGAFAAFMQLYACVDVFGVSRVEAAICA